MSVAALILWLLTAAGGFVLLGTWLAKGGLRRDAVTPSRLPSGLVFGHFLLAAVGLILWIIYLASDADTLTWVAFAILVVVAVLGFTMFFRWLPQYRARGTRSATATAEQQLPVPVVVAHGVFAAATLVLVFIAAINA